MTRKVFVVETAFVRCIGKGTIIEGPVAYDENGKIVTDAVGYPGGIIKRLLDMGYKPCEIFIKTWISLDQSTTIKID